MADTTNKQLRVIVVTPEKAVLDETTASVVLPLYDGELGVLPGRAAFVGQVAPGVLRLTDANGTIRKYFVDAGFAQVRGDVVNVLTAKAMPASEVTEAMATSARSAADALPAGDPVQRATREKALDRARGLAKAIGRL